MAERHEGAGVGWDGWLSYTSQFLSALWMGKTIVMKSERADRKRTGCPCKELSSSDLGKFHPTVPRELAEDMQNHCSFFLNKKECGQVPKNCGWKMIISERIRVVNSRGWDL